MADITIQVQAANEIHAVQALTTAENALAIRTTLAPGAPGRVLALYADAALWLRNTAASAEKFFVPAGTQFNIFVNKQELDFTIAAQAGTANVYYMTVS